MKALLILIVTLAALSTPARADEARIAALEATVAQLQTQNLTLKNAIEAFTGKSLVEILGATASPVVQEAAAPAPASAPADMVMGVPVAEAKARLAQLDAQAKAMTTAHEAALKEAAKPRDPFASRGGVKKSAADIQKEAGVRLEEIARVRAQAETLRQALAGR